MKKNIVILAGLTIVLSLTFVLPAFTQTALSVGQAAPDFTLPDTNGDTHSLSDFKGKTVVLEWVNHDCPFVRKHYDSGNMQGLQKEAAGDGVVWLSIGSSAPGKQGHFPANEWNQLTQTKGASPTAILLDPEGDVGKLYGAQTTPHMYVIDPDGNLVYQGAIDSVPSADKGDIGKAQNYVRTALGESMAGKSVSHPSTKAYGCSVKYAG